MDIIKLVSVFVSLLPKFVLDLIEKKVFEKPEFCSEYNLLDDTVYDIGLVFGGCIERAEKACELYKSGKIAKILFSGGIGKEEKFKTSGIKTEAEEYAKYASSYGIPFSDILIENASSNTKENVKNSVLLLKNEGYNLGKIKILVISSDFHVRRCLCLMMEYLHSEQLAWADVESEYRSNWRMTERGRFYIFKEFCQNIRKIKLV